jgi:succinoglycan biosynthesis transport protein ExoP
VSIEDRQTMTSQTLAQLNQSLSAVHAERLALESRRDQIKKSSEAGTPSDTIDEVNRNQLIQSLKTTRAQLRAEESELALKYTDDHPKLVAVRQKLDLLESELKTETDKVIAGLDEDYNAKLENESRLKAAIEEVKAEALDLNRKEIEYNRLKREKDNNQALYEMVLKRQKEADLSQMLKVNNVRKLEAATIPDSPVRPNARNNILIALVVGAIFGVGLALLVDYFDNTVKTQEQVENVLELPLLGIVPKINLAKGGEARDPADRDRFIVDHPRSSVAECSRTIRTNLLFMATERPAKKLLVTSSGPREGKSTTVVNLAITMAIAGSRSLLVDSDMRRPRLHKSFNLSNDVGLSNVIAGGARLDQAILPSGIERLDLLPCGPIPPNPAELLHTEAFKIILAELERRYERIWFDSPPVVAVTDALVIGGMADGVILVVEAGKTAWPFALQARRRLEDVGAKVFGVVLNNVDLDRDQSSGYYQYYYYRAGYHEETKSEPAKA